MAANKRTDFQIKNDKNLIIQLLRRGNITHQEITDRINARYKKDSLEIELSRQMVSLDIGSVLNEMDEERIKNREHLRALQESRLLFIANESYEGWKRSQKKKVKEMEKDRNGELGYDENSKTTEYPVGDPRFLLVSEKCIDKISQLNGLYKIESNKEKDNGLINELVDLLKPPKPKEKEVLDDSPTDS